MKNKQQGSASLIGVVIILLILGGIWWAYNDSGDLFRNSALDKKPESDKGYTVGNNNTTNSTTSNALTPTASNPAGNEPTVIQTSSNVFPGGSQYRSPFGLTLPIPASWQAYALTKNTVSYGGVVPTDSTTFTLSSGQTLTINVFTKEEWNKIRTQENAANQNVNSLGEGEYLGENATYIYSYIIHDKESEVRQILNNIISF